MTVQGRRPGGKQVLAWRWQTWLALVLLTHLGTATAAGAVTANTPNTAPHALWIPGLALGDGKTTQAGAWLLMGADKKPLRSADIRTIQNYVVTPDGKLLPTAASDATGLFGYLDAAGQWAVPPQFEAARAFTPEGLARVKRKGLWGFLGADLNLRIAHQFQEADGFANGMAAVMVKDKWGFIDTTGAMLVPAQYRRVWRYGKNGLARVAVGEKKYGFIDRKGSMVIAPQFDLALEFGNAPVTAAERKGLWGVIDGDGRWVSQPTLRQLDAFQDPGMAAFAPDYRSVGFIDTTAKVVIAPGPHSRVIRQGLILHGDRGGSHYRFIDTQGKTAITGPFEWTHDFSVEQPWVVARRKGEWGVVQRNGAWVAAGSGREPMLVDGDDNFASRPLSMWIHAGQAIEWKDAQGQTLYRLSERAAEAGKPLVWQLHAANNLVWTSPPQKNRLPLSVFFEPGEADVSEVAGNDWVGVAKKLLAQKSQPYLPYSLVFGGQRDPYDLQSIEDDDREQVKHGAFAVLAETYVDEAQWGQYYFLNDQRSALFKRLETSICAALRGAWGAPLNLGKPGTEHRDEGNLLCEWKLGNKTLAVTHFHESGDGDLEHQIRMVVNEPAGEPAGIKKGR